MRIEKILNNNVVITRNELNQGNDRDGEGIKLIKKRRGTKLQKNVLIKKFQLADDRVAKYFKNVVQENSVEVHRMVV